MARNTADACMFCGVNHSGNCPSDDKPVRKKALPKVERVRQHAQPAAVKDSPPVPAAGSKAGPARPPTNRPNLAAIKRVRDPELEELGRAITCFAAEDMLHMDELVKHRAIIALPAHTIDAMIWRQANGEAVRQRGS